MSVCDPKQPREAGSLRHVTPELCRRGAVSVALLGKCRTVAAAGAMAMSSIGVVLDAARLNSFAPPTLAGEMPSRTATTTPTPTTARTGS